MPDGLGTERVRTARLAGRRPEAGDAPAYVRCLTDPRIDEAAWPADLRTADAARDVLADYERHWARWGFGPWTVLLGEEIVGWVGLRHTDVEGRPEVEVLWLIAADHWNRGYATEMAREAVRVAFGALELDAIVAFTAVGNGASRAVMAKLGMVAEREFPRAGRVHVLYRLSR